jgi:lipopolysaccharide transport system ATP-binding protein
MVSDPVISVQAIGKQYRIGGPKRRYNNFSDRVISMALEPFRRLRTKAQPPAAEILWALKDVSFEVERGEVLGVIGRNGAGKSTLLKILSRVTTPTEGRAEIVGRVGSILEVGTGFHPELTGRENIYLNAAILGMRRAQIDDNLDAIIAFAEIDRFLDTPVKHYSSGMYVRLAFAVAAHVHPDVLIVDEALAVGDAAFQKKCLGHMEHAARDEARTVLFVSHNVGAVKALCTRAIWLDDGRLRMSGDPETVTKAYLDSDA